MTAQFPLGDFLDGLKTALTAREGLDGIAIYTADPGPDVDLSSVIVLGSGPISGNAPWAAFGNNIREDSPTIGITVLAVRAGAGETVAKAARDRVEALTIEILDQLRTPPQVGTQTFPLSNATYTFVQYAAEIAGVGSRVAALELKITIPIRVT